MTECSTCIEVKPKFIACSTSKCEWKMCHECAAKWYTRELKCPACRLPNELFRRHKRLRQYQCIFKICGGYMLFLAALLILGRFVMLLTPLGPRTLLCGGNYIICLQSASCGAVVIVSVICVLTIVIAIISTIANRYFR